MSNFRQACVARLRNPEGDYYATDPRAAVDLMKLEPQLHDIWEPACGEGHLAEEFLKAGKLSAASDLYDRGYEHQDSVVDFLGCSGSYPVDIVTNPPFKYALQFILKGLEIVQDGRYVCMFLPVTYLESRTRYEQLFSKFPPLKMWVYVKRTTCARGGDFERYKGINIRSYAWYVWKKGKYPGTQVLWIPPDL